MPAQAVLLGVLTHQGKSVIATNLGVVMNKRKFYIPKSLYQRL